jgi:hypothetical protein
MTLVSHQGFAYCRLLAICFALGIGDMDVKEKESGSRPEHQAICPALSQREWLLQKRIWPKSFILLTLVAYLSKVHWPKN